MASSKAGLIRERAWPRCALSFHVSRSKRDCFGERVCGRLEGSAAHFRARCRGCFQAIGEVGRSGEDLPVEGLGNPYRDPACLVHQGARVESLLEFRMGHWCFVVPRVFNPVLAMFGIGYLANPAIARPLKNLPGTGLQTRGNGGSRVTGLSFAPLFATCPGTRLSMSRANSSAFIKGDCSIRCRSPARSVRETREVAGKSCGDLLQIRPDSGPQVRSARGCSIGKARPCRRSYRRRVVTTGHAPSRMNRGSSCGRCKGRCRARCPRGL